MPVRAGVLAILFLMLLALAGCSLGSAQQAATATWTASTSAASQVWEAATRKGSAINADSDIEAAK